MDAAFWLTRWQNDELGWQLEQPHPLLQQAPAWWLQGGPVLVPLCGKSPDLHFLAKTAPVVGAELSQRACEDFFAEAGLSPHSEDLPPFRRYQYDNLCLWQGDFFALTAAQVTSCQRIYDRAALIALPARMRQTYVNQLRTLLPQAQLLLISLEYPPGEKQGPPFSVPDDEVRRLFSDCQIELLQELDLTGQGFARRRFATTVLTERSYLIAWTRSVAALTC